MNKENSNLILSTKAIKKLTKDELGYDLSSNAFDLLNKRVTDYLQENHSVERVNTWIKDVLQKASLCYCDSERKRIVRRFDLLRIIEDKEIEIETEKKREDFKFEQNEEFSENDFSFDIDCEIYCICSWRNIEIVQKTGPVGSGSSLDVSDLEEEIERLKKIIQIILNKQAELA